MTDRNDQTDPEPTPVGDPGAIDDVNSSGSDTGQENIPWAAVDSGQSDDIDNSLSQQGVSDRETVVDTERNESDEIADDEESVE